MNILHFNLPKVILTANVNIDTVIKVPQAFLNTVFYMGIIFIILILLSIFVLLIKLILNNSESGNSVKTPITNTGSLLHNQPGMTGETDLTKNTELVAVITAAIMASMGEDAPKDGLVVRTIRRSGTK